MKKLIFINYRRSDMPQAAHGLYAQLRARFGFSNVFMDAGEFAPGTYWPERLAQALNEATVMISIIGPHWLKASDEYGRRKLDNTEDWVRKEIICALSQKKPIIPILVGGTSSLPPSDALPIELRNMLNYQAISLRNDKWDRDIIELIEILVSKFNFVDNQKGIALPNPILTIKPLSEDQLHNHLENLSGWEPIETMVPGDYPKSRQELRKVYEFRSFQKAIQFMMRAVDPIDKVNHHPRWENQWKSLTVYLSTWDIGNKISKLDIDLAVMLDSLYEEFTKQNKEKNGT